MPTGLRRYYGQGHLHFVTFSCYRRLPLLKSARARDLFTRELAKVRDELGIRLIGYVVMPEHVHLLMGEPPRGTPSTVLQKLKLRMARKMRKRRKSAPTGQMRLPFEECGEPLRAFWQARFYDFNVYSERKRLEKLDYMHANPITRKLVSHPKDWPPEQGKRSFRWTSKDDKNEDKSRPRFYKPKPGAPTPGTHPQSLFILGRGHPVAASSFT